MRHRAHDHVLGGGTLLLLIWGVDQASRCEGHDCHDPGSVSHAVHLLFGKCKLAVARASTAAYAERSFGIGFIHTIARALEVPRLPDTEAHLKGVSC